jgi:hypothetical protein
LNTPERVIRRALINVEPQGDCIVSRYSISTHGYAQIGWTENRKTQMRLVHRVAWEAAHGPIPADMTVDHLCHNRKCLRLSHLRLLSNVDNGKRNAPGRDFPVGWFCRNGHPESSRVPVKRGTRMGFTCRDCVRESQKRWADAHSEQIAAAHRRYRETHQEQRRELSRKRRQKAKADA